MISRADYVIQLRLEDYSELEQCGMHDGSLVVGLDEMYL
jgi:hypothetical protein